MGGGLLSGIGRGGFVSSDSSPNPNPVAFEEAWVELGM